tara:strand:+ start:2979 stop:3593 length:615 start_codon:yes stop_codon:yes gene_type:complete
MIVKGNKPIFFNLHSSFKIAKGDFESEDSSIRNGCCFSPFEGEAFSIEGGDIELNKIKPKKSVHLGIRRDSISFKPVEARLYYGEEKEEKKGDKENAWTWIELIGKDGSISSLDNDILFTKLTEEEEKSHFIFEEYENETILKFSHNGVLQTLTVREEEEGVIIQDLVGNTSLIPFEDEEVVIDSETEAAIAIVSVKKRLVVAL